MFDAISAHYPEIKEVVLKAIANNQFLQGGVVTVVVGSILVQLRSVPTHIKGWFLRTFTTSVSIREADVGSSKFNIIANYLAVRRVHWFGRNFSAVHSKPIILVVGYGTTYSLWSRKWVKVTKSITQTTSAYQSANNQLDLLFWSRDLKLLDRFVTEASYEVPDEVPKLDMYFSTAQGWMNTTKRLRSMDTVFANQDVKDQLINRFTAFRADEDKYTRRGVPYKFVVILHGPPGTGKTSLIHALASTFMFNVRYLSYLSDIKKIQGCPENSLVVLEDVDLMASLKRVPPIIANNNEPTSINSIPEFDSVIVGGGSALHELLQVLDGFETPYGMMVIMTTNQIGALDEAMIRPGRIDLTLEVTPLTGEATTQMFGSFYGEEKIALIQDWMLQNDYIPQVGARLQETFMTHTAEAAIMEFDKLFRVKHIRVIEDNSRQASA